MNKNFTKLIILCLIAGSSFTACKKSSDNKPTDSSTYSMKFSINGTAISYSTCVVAEVDAGGSKYVDIAGVNAKTPNNSLQIELVTGVANLKAGQTYQVTTDYLGANTASFDYSPDGTNDFTTQPASPSGTVTITDVSSTTLKGTFTAKLYSGDDIDATTLKYTVTSGTFVAQLPQ